MISQQISHYRIINQLGVGGMGEVYEVAIRVVYPAIVAGQARKIAVEFESLK